MKTEDAKIRQILLELSQRCKSYHGQFFELIKPISDKYDMAVKVGLQKFLKYLVVADESAASICSEFLKEKQLQMEVLVLSNIPDR